MRLGWGRSWAPCAQDGIYRVTPSARSSMLSTEEAQEPRLSRVPGRAAREPGWSALPRAGLEEGGSRPLRQDLLLVVLLTFC